MFSPVTANMRIPQLSKSTLYLNASMGSTTSMNDKSSWDTSAFVPFYFHLALILRYPRPPIQCCAGTVVCDFEQIE